VEHLKPEHVRQVLDRAFTRLVETLNQSSEPWMHRYDPWADVGLSPDVINTILGADAPWSARNMAAASARKAVAARDPSRWAEVATQELEAIGVEPDQESPLFQELCVELTKLELLQLDAEIARSHGDFSKERDRIGHFLKNGYRLIPSAQSNFGGGPRLSEAWREYFEEKSQRETGPGMEP
jgi:hypothetical protein